MIWNVPWSHFPHEPVGDPSINTLLFREISVCSIDCRVFKISISAEPRKHCPQANSIMKTFSLKVFFPPWKSKYFYSSLSALRLLFTYRCLINGKDFTEGGQNYDSFSSVFLWDHGIARNRTKWKQRIGPRTLECLIDPGNSCAYQMGTWHVAGDTHTFVEWMNVKFCQCLKNHPLLWGRQTDRNAWPAVFYSGDDICGTIPWLACLGPAVHNVTTLLTISSKSNRETHITQLPRPMAGRGEGQEQGKALGWGECFRFACSFLSRAQLTCPY